LVFRALTVAVNMNHTLSTVQGADLLAARVFQAAISFQICGSFKFARWSGYLHRTGNLNFASRAPLFTAWVLLTAVGIELCKILKLARRGYDHLRAGRERAFRTHLFPTGVL